ncbi:unnamed protein product [Mytilus coruscus]|uniref:Reverse transcriptase domain-containing protein n=1 Tax=Mytilus coruscus TaxID=42192 RepID=A0A6J8ANR5_MYTCO|nr:unnamed protein product [Mytilus coruscus]
MAFRQNYGVYLIICILISRVRYSLVESCQIGSNCIVVLGNCKEVYFQQYVLYLIFINDLIEKLESCQQGAFIHVLNASSPVQADDISIIATDRQSSHAVVKICEEYSIRWSFAFSAGKCQLLHFGKRTTGTDVLLYNEPISTVKTAKHCGIKLYTCLKSMDRTINVYRTLRATVISLIRLGVHPAI